MDRQQRIRRACTAPGTLGVSCVALACALSTRRLAAGAGAWPRRHRWRRDRRQVPGGFVLGASPAAGAGLAPAVGQAVQPAHERAWPIPTWMLVGQRFELATEPGRANATCGWWAASRRPWQQPARHRPALLRLQLHRHLPQHPCGCCGTRGACSTGSCGGTLRPPQHRQPARRRPVHRRTAPAAAGADDTLVIGVLPNIGTAALQAQYENLKSLDGTHPGHQGAHHRAGQLQGVLREHHARRLRPVGGCAALRPRGPGRPQHGAGGDVRAAHQRAVHRQARRRHQRPGRRARQGRWALPTPPRWWRCTACSGSARPAWSRARISRCAVPAPTWAWVACCWPARCPAPS